MLPHAGLAAATTRISASLFLGLALAAGLAAQTSHPETFRIAGRVVNSSTGEPLARAAVAALAEQDSHTVASAFSDADGRFVIESVPAGKYPLTASKRGFRTAFYDEHEDFNTAIVTGQGQDTEHLQFRLVPAAVLRGTVTGDGGDMVEGASVMLFRKPDPARPGEKIAQVEVATTDDTGAYEFGNLAAGEYFVAVKADPWYALHGQANRNPGNESTNLDVAYPITFFDSSIDEASAAPIALAEGSSEQANVSLHAVPALHLRLPRTARRGGPPIELQETVFGSQIRSHGSDLLAEQHGTIEITGVAPGHYQLTHGDPPRTVELDASSDLDIDPSAGSRLVSVTGTLHGSGGAPITEDANAVLEPADGASRTPSATIVRKGLFQFDNVLPGRWALSVYSTSNGQSMPVVSIASGQRSKAGNEITVADQPVNIAVSISRTQTRVLGFARLEAKPAVGVMVVLVPRDPGAYQALVRRDQSDSDGSFSLRDVPPGPYTLIAIEGGWKLDWRRREVMAPYLSRGVAITIGDPSAPVVQVNQIVPAVPR